jgi:hypothetical protein
LWIKEVSSGYLNELWSEGGSAAEMSEQARKVKKHIPEWAEGLYYNSGLISEVLVYYDDEAIYFECRGKDSGIARFSFEMLETLSTVIEEESENSTE